MAHAALLLLPPPPEPANYATIKAAYNAPLLLALRKCSYASTGSTLDVALPCPQLYGKSSETRASAFTSTQAILANLYKLVTILAARDGINVEDSSGVDVRILLVAYPRDGQLQNTHEQKTVESTEGPIIDLATLARCYKRWSVIYSVESEEGEQVLRNFRDQITSSVSVQKLRGGIVQVHQSHGSPDQSVGQFRAHYHVAVGGTFDHLHIGHKLLLTMVLFAVDLASTGQDRAITVGITAEDLLKNKKYAEFLQDWHERYAITHAFIHGLMSFDPNNLHPEDIMEVKNPGPNGHTILARYPSGFVIHYVEIWDPFGPTITVEAIDALVISAETRAGGKAVNDKRQEKGWKKLDVYEVDVLDAEESDDQSAGQSSDSKDMQQAFQNKLSSTEIRKKAASSSKSLSKV